MLPRFSQRYALPALAFEHIRQKSQGISLPCVRPRAFIVPLGDERHIANQAQMSNKVKDKDS
jgi:hypothetical protein